MKCPDFELNPENEFIGCDGVKVSNDILMLWIKKANDEERYEDSQRYYKELERRQDEFFVLELFGGGNNTLNGEWSVVAASHDIDTEPGFDGYEKAKEYVIEKLKESDKAHNFLIVGWNDFEYQEIMFKGCGPSGIFETRHGYNLKPGIFRLMPY